MLSGERALYLVFEHMDMAPGPISISGRANFGRASERSRGPVSEVWEGKSRRVALGAWGWGVFGRKEVGCRWFLAVWGSYGASFVRKKPTGFNVALA